MAKKPYLSKRELRDLFAGTAESRYGKRCIIVHKLAEGDLEITVMAGNVSGGKGSETVEQRFQIMITEEAV